MDSDLPVVDALNDPAFRAYFLNLISSAATDEEKYARLLDYFHAHGAGQPVELPPAVGEDPDVSGGGLPEGWDVDAILARTAESIRRAVEWVSRDQNRDGGWEPGGWGSRPEGSSTGHTANAVLCLLEARRCSEITVDVDLGELLQTGCAYLEQHAAGWATDTLEPEGALPVRDLSLVARLFFNGGRDFLRKETAVRIYRGIERLHRAQNADGGWDASLWGYAVVTPTRLFSEVSATTAAMLALAEVRDDRFVAAMQRAGLWLANTQNLEGSWNNGSTRPYLPSFVLAGDPRAGQTFEALQGFSALRAFALPAAPYQVAEARALAWTRRSLAPLLERARNRGTWTWGYTAEEYRSVCLALETLLRLPQVPLEPAGAYAGWLVETQRRQPGDAEDGAWVLGHTARIAAALIGFYHAVQGAARATTGYQGWMP